MKIEGKCENYFLKMKIKKLFLVLLSHFSIGFLSRHKTTHTQKKAHLNERRR